MQRNRHSSGTWPSVGHTPESDHERHWPGGLLYTADGVSTATTQQACAGRARLRPVGALRDDCPDQGFLGLGLYRSYLANLPRFITNIARYYPGLARGRVILVMAGALQQYNLPECAPMNSRERRKRRRFLRDRQRVAEELQSLTGRLRDASLVAELELLNWEALWRDARYQQILERVRLAYSRDLRLRDEVRATTAHKTGLGLSNPALDWRAQYALEEIASIFYYHERGVAKLTYGGENGYDAAAIELLLREHHLIEPTRRGPLRLIDVDQPPSLV